jgi:hypothetical protein
MCVDYYIKIYREEEEINEALQICSFIMRQALSNIIVFYNSPTISLDPISFMIIRKRVTDKI